MTTDNRGMTEPSALPQRDQYDVIVIGSGAGGTTAAAMLAKAGQSVLLAEQWESPGGYAHAFHREQYTIDPAVHLITDKSLYEALLRHLDNADSCTYIHPDHLAGARFREFGMYAPLAPVEEFIEAHASALPNRAGEIRDFWGLCLKMHTEAHQLPAALALDRLADAVERFPTLFAYRRATVGQVLDDVVADPKAKAVCGAPGAILGPPNKLPFMLFSQLVMSHLVEEAFFCEGGTQVLVEAILEGFNRAGGELLLGSRVTKVLIEGGRVAGVEIAGEQVRAPVVVSNASATQTYEELVGPENVPGPFLNSLRRMKPSDSGFILFGATTLDLAELGLAHTNFFCPAFDVDDAYRRSAEGKPGGSFIVRAPTVVDPTLAPAGEHIFTVLAFRPYELDRPWQEERPRFAEQVTNEMDEWLPGFKDSLVFSDSATPLTLQRFTLNDGGACYGWDNTVANQGSRRPPQRGAVPGLYLTGHWSRPGVGFLRCTVSGIHTAQFVMADLNLQAAPFEHQSLPPAV